MNPIAIGTILLGLLLLAVGWILVTRGRKTAGRAVAVMGVCLLLIPFIVTYTLSRSNRLCGLEDMLHELVPCLAVAARCTSCRPARCRPGGGRSWDHTAKSPSGMLAVDHVAVDAELAGLRRLHFEQVPQADLDAAECRINI